MKVLLQSLLIICLALNAFAQESERPIYAEIVIEAGIDAVWNAWTTEAGAKSFFTPDCKIDFRVGGEYEMYFYPTGEAGQRGAEGTKILAIQPKKMLSFTWNNPAYIPSVQWQYTSVIVRLSEMAKDKTKVSLYHSGWGEGKDWDEAYAFFDKGWRGQVLPYLKHSLEVGPVDWNNPPQPMSN
jgi:uncharacterized protein YndB with AHSA1/START domain